MTRATETPFVQTVFHPSDFSTASGPAFAHALAISLLRGATLTVVHVDNDPTNWCGFPAVHGTMQRWGLLDEDHPEGELLERMRVHVRNLNLKAARPLDAILDHIDAHPQDLIVLGTQARTGLPRWLSRSTAERIARGARTMTLFIPEGARGFVRTDDAHLTLRRVLVPIAADPTPVHALEYARRIVRIGGDEDSEVTVLHIGDPVALAATRPTGELAGHWNTLIRDGDVVSTILEVANERGADLIVMPTAGRDSLVDTLRGTVTERVLRDAKRPLLAVPPMA